MNFIQLRNKDYGKLSDIAFENDYSDQSHLIRSFKEFAGISPNQYQKQYNELAEFLRTGKVAPGWWVA